MSQRERNLGGRDHLHEDEKYYLRIIMRSSEARRNDWIAVSIYKLSHISNTTISAIEMIEDCSDIGRVSTSGF